MKKEVLLYDKFDICVTNYESLIIETHAFSKFGMCGERERGER